MTLSIKRKDDCYKTIGGSLTTVVCLLCWKITS